MIKKIVLSKYHINKPLKKKSDLTKIANLIIQIFPEYYNCFKSSKFQLKKIIEKLFFKKNFEFQKIYTMKLGNELVGVATVINSKNLKIAKTLGFLKMVEHLGINKINKAKINNLRKSFTEINSSSPYLTRFGINTKFRGINDFSSKLMKYILDNEKKKLIAHVSKNNKRALKFYLKNKFKVINKKNIFYLIEFK